MEVRIFLRSLIDKWWVILFSVFIIVGTTLIYTLNQAPVYSARTTYVVSPTPEIFDNTDFLGGLSILGGQPFVENMYASIATSPAIIKNAMNALGLTSLQSRQLTVDSRVQFGTNIIEINVEGNDPLLVQALANQIGKSTQEYVNSLYKVFYLHALDSAESPKQPSSPNIKLNVIISLALSLVFGGGIVLWIGLKYY